MGVKSYVWGPHAWVVAHSIAFSMDSKHHENEANLPFWNLFVRVLPCVVCRESALKLLDDAQKQQETVEDEKNMHLIHSLHNMVNKKLYDQKNITCIPYPYASVTYFDVCSEEFQKHLVTFICFVMSDTHFGDMEKQKQVVDLLEMIDIFQSRENRQINGRKSLTQKKITIIRESKKEDIIKGECTKKICDAMEVDELTRAFYRWAIV